MSSEQHHGKENVSAKPTKNEDEVLTPADGNVVDLESDDASEVESFILETGGPIIEASKILLTRGDAGSLSIDDDTQQRLTLLLEAAGIGKLSTAEGKFFTDPEVLQQLTRSVGSALDEAAATITRMRDPSHRSLAEACSEGDVPTVRQMLQDGRSVHETTEDGESLLSLACSSGYYELVQVLLAMNANVEDRGSKGDCTPLMEAAGGGHVSVVQLLIDHKANIAAQSQAGNMALHYACANGCLDVVRILLDKNSPIEEQNENGHTPLMEAASAGHVDIAELLLRQGAGINTHSNEFKESALTLACYKGHLDMVRFLLENGADHEHKTDEMHTALMEACMDGHAEVADLLLSHGTEVNMPVDSFESPLTLAACGGHVELGMLLIERGANLEEVNDEGYTPLMEASREGHEDMVSLLISQGAQVDAQTEVTQETALTLACYGGFLDVVSVLLAASSNIEQGCSTPLMEAAHQGHNELVKFLILQGAKVDATTATGDTALSFASENGHRDVIETLLSSGGALEHESEGGRTPLMKASKQGHLRSVQFLISKGADVNRTTSNNEHTVLSLACAGGHMDVVKLLLAQKSNPYDKLKDGSTALIEAAKGGYTGIACLLLDYPKSQDQIDVCTGTQVPVSVISPALGSGNPRTTSAIYQQPVGAHLPVQPIANLGSFVNMPAQPGMHCKPDHSMIATAIHQNHVAAWHQQQINLANSYASQVTQTFQQQTILPHPGDYILPQQQNLLSRLPPPVCQDRCDDMDLQLSKDDLTSSICQLSLSPSMINAGIQYQLTSTPNPFLPTNCGGPPPSPEHNIQSVQQKQNKKLKREEQLQRKQEILDELQKVERELQEKTHLRSDHTSGGITMDQPPASPMALSPEAAQILTEATLQTLNNLSQSELTALLQQQVDQLPVAEQARLLQLTQLMEQTSQYYRMEFTGHPQQPANLPRPVGNGVRNIPLTTTLNHAPGDSTCLQQPMFVTSVLATTTTTSTTTTSMSPPTMADLPPPDPCTGSSAGVEIDAQTDSNHDTALTLASAGGHETLVSVLIKKGGDIEHKDKKGFTSLMLAATAGHKKIVELLLEARANMEAQSERTKDTALSLACSGGREEVVKVLLERGANKEHRNVSDYTPLSLAASGGYVNIIKLLLEHQAEINSRTNSKLGISPLMLAAMNGHTAAVKHLLNEGSDINAQIETNKNTALTLACFQGRHEVVSLLVDRKANVEHRAKTGLTPLMEAASGGYVEVGRVLLNHGADVNAAPVPSSKDTALTIASDKGHIKFCDLVISRGAHTDARTKKGSTPLWLSANGGHLEVVQLLIAAKADANVLDNRKISCLVAAFRKGHIKVVRLITKFVKQFPSDTDCRRYISTLSPDKQELVKKCHTCMDMIVSAKDRQAAEANKVASNLLKELESEKKQEESRKAAVAKKREKKKKQKKKKKTKDEEINLSREDDDDELENNDDIAEKEISPDEGMKCLRVQDAVCNLLNDRLLQRSSRDVRVHGPEARNSYISSVIVSSTTPSTSIVTVMTSSLSNMSTMVTSFSSSHTASSRSRRKGRQPRHPSPNYADIPIDSFQQETRISEPPRIPMMMAVVTKVSPKKKKDDSWGWKEVTRNRVIPRTKKIYVPSPAISRVIGRGGCNINAIREHSGAHIEVEKLRANQQDRSITIKGQAEPIRVAHHLISALIKCPDKEVNEIIDESLGNSPASNSMNCEESASSFLCSRLTKPLVTTTMSAKIAVIPPRMQSAKNKPPSSMVTSADSSTMRPPGLATGHPSAPAWGLPPSKPFSSRPTATVTGTAVSITYSTTSPPVNYNLLTPSQSLISSPLPATAPLQQTSVPLQQATVPPFQMSQPGAGDNSFESFLLHITKESRSPNVWGSGSPSNLIPSIVEAPESSEVFLPQNLVSSPPSPPAFHHSPSFHSPKEPLDRIDHTEYTSHSKVPLPSFVPYQTHSEDYPHYSANNDQYYPPPAPLPRPIGTERALNRSRVPQANDVPTALYLGPGRMVSFNAFLFSPQHQSLPNDQSWLPAPPTSQEPKATSSTLWN